MKNLINSPKSVVFIILLFFMTIVGYAQGVPGGTLPNNNDDVNDEAPISSLVVLGLIAGTAFGIKKLK